MFYIYDTQTKEYLSETTGQLSPLEDGVYFQPASSTIIQPMSETATQKPQWNGATWDLVDDNRGDDYWYKATKEKVIFQFGDSADTTMTTQEPQAGEEWNGSQWETPIDDAKETKYAEIYAHADSLIAEQEDTFFTKGSNRGRNKDRLLKQQNKRNNKKIKGQTLNPNEQAEEDRYDSFMEWSEDVYDEADKSRDKVENYPHVEQVKNYNVETEPNWPTP